VGCLPARLRAGRASRTRARNRTGSGSRDAIRGGRREGGLPVVGKPACSGLCLGASRGTLEDPAASGIMRSPIVFFEVADGHGLAMAGAVDKFSVFQVDAHVVDAAFGAEKDEVAFAEFVFGHGGAGLELLAGRAGQMDAVLVENPGGESGTIETGAGIAAAGAVRSADLGGGGA